MFKQRRQSRKGILPENSIASAHEKSEGLDCQTKRKWRSGAIFHMSLDLQSKRNSGGVREDKKRPTSDSYSLE